MRIIEKMLIFTCFFAVFAVQSAATTIFNGDPASQQSASAGRSLLFLQEELKKYRHFAKRLGLPGISGRMGQARRFIMPLMGTAIGGATIGYIAHGMSDAASNFHEIAGKSGYDIDYDEYGDAIGYYDNLTDDSVSGKLPDNPNELLPKEPVAQGAEPIVTYGTIGAGALSGYGVYRLIAMLIARARKRRLQTKLEELIAKLPWYEKEIPGSLLPAFKKLHFDMAVTGVTAIPQEHIRALAAWMTDVVTRHVHALQKQITELKKAHKKRVSP